MDNLNYKKFLDGNLEGFENLVIKYKDNLIFFILKYIKDINLAEDIVQDAFVDIYIYKERYNFKSSFKTYLFTIGRKIFCVLIPLIWKVVLYFTLYASDSSF